MSGQRPLVESAAERAVAQVRAVQDDPVGRLTLAAETYRGPFGHAPSDLPFRRAPLSFMRWEVERGVPEPLDGDRPGSPWWRALNDRLLRDGCEAVARAAGLRGEPGSSAIDAWMSGRL